MDRRETGCSYCGDSAVEIPYSKMEGAGKMKSLIFSTAGLLIGISLLAGGGYYLLKEKGDKDSVKIFGAFVGIGVVITSGMIIKIIMAGF